ncbi:MAG: hypothetical protein JNK21_07550 [Rhodospirillaceae bacterium]|nr:hypothetical protein [Rhodospirillaceae bacterium]
MSTILPGKIVGDAAVDDRDTLHSIKLSTLPVSHAALRKARMIKNCRLQSVIELYRDQNSGSGQIAVDQLDVALGIPSSGHPDLVLLRGVALLPAFDAFSVRLLLREMGATPEQLSAIGVSPEKQRQLDKFMETFTLPLLRYVYGRQDVGQAGMQQLFAMFRNPDVALAQSHLTRLASKVRIPVAGIPGFLENYSDTFLAIAFYQQSYQDLVAVIASFLEAVRDVAAQIKFKHNQVVKNVCEEIEQTFRHVMKAIGTRLSAAERLAAALWADDVTAPFQVFQGKLREFQVLIGMLLCSLAAKVDAWRAAFPNAKVGSTQARAQMISADIAYGMPALRQAANKGLARTATAAVDEKMNLSADGASFLKFLRQLAPP